MINMADPSFSSRDRDFIHKGVEKILTGKLSMGPFVSEFENKFKDFVGVKHAIAMNSCTSALEASLGATKISGKEVLLPAQTFIATCAAVENMGGIPIICEIEAETLCLDFEDMKKKINENTGAVIIVHMAGLMSENIFQIKSYLDQFNIPLIEDAAHSPGASLNNFKAGSVGSAGCFSFYPTKVITTGEGGMLTTNDENVAKYAKSFQHRGRDMDSQVELYSNFGRNVRMQEISALLGVVQLKNIGKILERRRLIADTYIKGLSNIDLVHLVCPRNLESSAFWKFPIILDRQISRKSFSEILKKNGVMSDFAYNPAIHQQPAFIEKYGEQHNLIKTDDILERHVCLPVHQNITEIQALHVVKIVKLAIEKLKK